MKAGENSETDAWLSLTSTGCLDRIRTDEGRDSVYFFAESALEIVEGGFYETIGLWSISPGISFCLCR